MDIARSLCGKEIESNALKRGYQPPALVAKNHNRVDDTAMGEAISTNGFQTTIMVAK
jgi:methionyl-tRNA synthetase